MDYPRGYRKNWMAGGGEKVGWLIRGMMTGGGVDGCRINELRRIGWRGKGGWAQRATERLETDIASV